jgi:PhnB protein
VFSYSKHAGRGGSAVQQTPQLQTVTLPGRRTTMSEVPHIPKGYQTVTPYLIVKDAARAIEFYKQALGAVELVRMEVPNGTVAHAELQIGDSRIMLGEEAPQMGYRSATTIGATPVSLYVYLPNCDGAIQQAVSAGAELKRPIENQFYGDRSGTIHDPFGHVWTLATHIEDVSQDEMEKRMKKLRPAA